MVVPVVTLSTDCKFGLQLLVFGPILSKQLRTSEVSRSPPRNPSEHLHRAALPQQPGTDSARLGAIPPLHGPQSVQQRRHEDGEALRHLVPSSIPLGSLTHEVRDTVAGDLLTAPAERAHALSSFPLSTAAIEVRGASTQTHQQDRALRPSPRWRVGWLARQPCRVREAGWSADAASHRGTCRDRGAGWATVGASGCRGCTRSSNARSAHSAQPW